MSWEETKLAEAEAEKIKASAELNRTTPEYMEAALASAQLQHGTSRGKHWINRMFHWLTLVCGKALLIHLTWATTVVAVTWIVVVYGWRGS